jgi:hypothetical protein
LIQENNSIRQVSTLAIKTRTSSYVILPLSDTGSAAGSAIGTGHGLLALLAVLESSGIHVLDLNWKEERKKLD